MFLFLGAALEMGLKLWFKIKGRVAPEIFLTDF